MSSELDVDWNLFEDEFDSEDWKCLLSQADLLEVEEIPILEDIPASDLEDIGQSHEDWLDFIKHFPSGKHYHGRVLHFIEWKMLNIGDDNIFTTLKRYFRFHHDQKKTVDGIERSAYAPTVFRSWFSMFCKFWKVTEMGSLRDLCPALPISNIRSRSTSHFYCSYYQ